MDRHYYLGSVSCSKSRIIYANWFRYRRRGPKLLFTTATVVRMPNIHISRISMESCHTPKRHIESSASGLAQKCHDTTPNSMRKKSAYIFVNPLLLGLSPASSYMCDQLF